MPAKQFSSQNPLPFQSLINSQTQNISLLDTNPHLYNFNQTSHPFQFNSLLTLSQLIFKTYQQMQLSIQSLILAMSFSQSHQIKQLIQQQISRIFTLEKSHFQSVNQVLIQISSRKRSIQQAVQLILKIYSISLLYLAHKIIDDFKYKFASNVWAQHLRQDKITKIQIKKAESQIVSILNFDLFRPNILTMIAELIIEMKIKSDDFVYFIHYLLEIYLNRSMDKFIGKQNDEKKVKVMLGCLRLGCHFLSAKSWNDRILRRFNLGVKQVEKQSKKLFRLLIDKQRNINIHEKYKMQRYKRIGNIKIVQIKTKSDQNVQNIII